MPQSQDDNNKNGEGKGWRTWSWWRALHKRFFQWRHRQAILSRHAVDSLPVSRERYHQWKSTPAHIWQLTRLRTRILEALRQPGGASQVVQIVHQPEYTQIVVQAIEPEFPGEFLLFVQEWICERLQALGYILQLRDVRRQFLGDYLYRIYRCFLKMDYRRTLQAWDQTEPLLSSSVRFPQGYGTILIETFFQGERVVFWRWTCQRVRDALVEEAEPFEKLVTKILDAHSPGMGTF